MQSICVTGIVASITLSLLVLNLPLRYETACLNHTPVTPSVFDAGRQRPDPEHVLRWSWGIALELSSEIAIACLIPATITLWLITTARNWHSLALLRIRTGYAVLSACLFGLVFTLADYTITVMVSWHNRILSRDLVIDDLLTKTQVSLTTGLMALGAFVLCATQKELRSSPLRSDRLAWAIGLAWVVVMLAQVIHQSVYY
jgi:hypothetical protein